MAAIVALLVSVVSLQTAGAAVNSVALSIGPDYPNTVTVGDTNVPTVLRILNNSTGVGPVTLTQIALNPACGDVSNNACGSPDPGVITLAPSGVGRVGTACAGVIFTITGPDVSGQYLFVPSTTVVLDVPNTPGAGCDIGYSFNVARAPSIDAAPAPGLQTGHFASVRATAQTTAAPIATLTGGGVGTSISTIQLAPATITTVATPAATLSQPIADTATVTGPAAAPTPTGTVVFTAFGPADATCQGPAAFTSPAAPLAAGPAGPPNGATASTTGFTPTLPGTYRWVAVYSGDANYGPVTSPCNAANESSVVTRPVATINTAATGGPVGTAIRDVATVGGPAGGPAPTGTVTFALFSDATCTTQVFTSTNAIAGGSATSASFTPTMAGAYFWVATYSGDALFLPVTAPCGSPNEMSTVTKVQPAITTDTSAPTVRLALAPAVTPAFTDTATLSGGVAPTGTITFRLYGPNDATCAQAPIFTSIVNVAGNGAYTSAPPFTPTTAGTYSWRATYSGDANNLLAGPGPCGEARETTRVLGVPTILVTKSASPPTRVEPGGVFTFTVVVTNTSAEALTITSLVDNPYGNLSGQGTCGVGAVLAPDPDGTGPGLGGRYTCTFDGLFNGPPGAQQTDIVTAVAVTSDNTPATNTATATVMITNLLPSITVVKTAAPSSLPEPGGQFTFTVVVTNTSMEQVKITSLVDDVYPNLTTRGTCTTAINQLLAPSGGKYTCTFQASFIGDAGASQTDTITANVVDQSGDMANATGSATVTLTDVPPTVLVTKTATPLTLPEPGGQFSFAVVVTNTSAEAVKITQLTDNIYGNIATKGSCTDAINTSLAADPDGAGPALGGIYRCSFTGSFIGDAGQRQTDIVTVTVVDNEKTPASATANATVSLTDVKPTVIVAKSATPLTLPEPGGTFTFNVLVTNTSVEAVTIKALVDDKYGDISTKGTCVTAVNTSLAADPDGGGPLLGGTYACSFSGDFISDAGKSQTDVVTVTVADNEQNTATATANATVNLTDVKPTVQVVKTATPESRPAPGGAFTFDVVVKNTSAEDVTIRTLTDDVHGNIATQGTCTSAIGTVLPPQATYSCSFPGTFTGTSGSQKDIVTVSVTDNENNTVTATDDATVTITPVATPVTTPPRAVEGQTVVNAVPVTPQTVTYTPKQTTTLAKTGASVTGLVLLALGLLGFGGLLLAGSHWVPTTAAAASLVGGDGRWRSLLRRRRTT